MDKTKTYGKHGISLCIGLCVSNERDDLWPLYFLHLFHVKHLEKIWKCWGYHRWKADVDIACLGFDVNNICCPVHRFIQLARLCCIYLFSPSWLTHDLSFSFFLCVCLSNGMLRIIYTTKSCCSSGPHWVWDRYLFDLAFTCNQRWVYLRFKGEGAYNSLSGFCPCGRCLIIRKLVIDTVMHLDMKFC